MTSKDLLLVCLVAGAVGAGAAFAASVLHEPRPAPELSDELAARLDRIENALARAAEGQKEAKEATSRLNERVTSLQIDVGAAREEAAQASRAASETRPEASAEDGQATRPGRAKRPFVFRGGEALAPGGRVLLGGKEGSADVALEALRGQMPEISKRLESLGKGLGLRVLPEAERWKKAQDELRLSDGQVQFLKDAVAERDKAMKEMMVETSEDAEGGSRITIKRLDPAKAAQAQSDYQRKVAQTLDSEQKKGWDEKGYDNAFGGAGGGRSIAVVQAVDMTVEEPAGGK